MVGVAAAGYLGYRAWLYFSEQSQIKQAAREVGVDPRELGRAVEAFKHSLGMRPRDNLTMDQVRQLAGKSRLDCGKEPAGKRTCHPRHGT